MGQNMFRGFAVILICWYGVKSALSAASGGPMNSFHFENFGGLLLQIAFGFGMMTYYSQPIPGMGISFYHLIVDQGLSLSNQLNHSLVQEIWDRLNGIYFGMEMPGLSIVLNVMELIRYTVVILCLIAAQAAIFAVIAFGYVATAIVVLLGPIFIPFFIVPQMEWLFRGWLKAFIQYAFYPVVANAYLFVFGNLLIHFVDSHPAPYDGATILILFFPLVLLLLAFTYGILKIPSLVNSLFTGRSGESAMWPL
jgi:type IV secretory pathway VirB6-like protein